MILFLPFSIKSGMRHVIFLCELILGGGGVATPYPLLKGPLNLWIEIPYPQLKGPLNLWITTPYPRLKGPLNLWIAIPYPQLKGPLNFWKATPYPQLKEPLKLWIATPYPQLKGPLNLWISPTQRATKRVGIKMWLYRGNENGWMGGGMAQKDARCANAPSSRRLRDDLIEQLYGFLWYGI